MSFEVVGIKEWSDHHLIHRKKKKRKREREGRTYLASWLKEAHRTGYEDGWFAIRDKDWERERERESYFKDASPLKPMFVYSEAKRKEVGGRKTVDSG